MVLLNGVTYRWKQKGVRMRLRTAETGEKILISVGTWPPHHNSILASRFLCTRPSLKRTDNRGNATNERSLGSIEAGQFLS